MKRRQCIVGLCALCALAISAFAANSAGATTKGTTAYTCTNLGGTGFADAHCKSASGSGSFSHVGLGENTEIEVTGSNVTTGNERSTISLTSTQAGVAVEIQASLASVWGWLENKKSASGEHYVQGLGGAITAEFNWVEVTKPAGKGCKVRRDLGGVASTEGFVASELIDATTEGQGDFAKFYSPFETLATFFIEGCSKAELNGTYKVTGSLKGVPTGATVNFSGAEVTAQGTLLLRGQKAGLNGALTFSGRANSTQEYTPLTETTIETP